MTGSDDTMREAFAAVMRTAHGHPDTVGWGRDDE